MKILWFTSTPSLAASVLKANVIGGSWINSLEERLIARNNVELAIGFHYPVRESQKIQGNKTKYYIVPDKYGKVQKFIRRHLNVIERPGDIDLYLSIIEDFKPELIHIFGTENNFGLIIQKTEIPVIIHLQGILTVYQLKWFASGMNQFQVLRNSSPKKILFGNSLYQNYFKFKKAARREREIFGMCRYFLGRTDWDRRITSILGPEAKYFHCDEMIRSEFFQATWNKKPGAIKILFSTIQGNIYKGLETILHSAYLMKMLNKVEFEWRIAGIDQNDEIVRITEGFLKKRSYDLNIVYLGSLQTGELIAQLLEGDVFVHPSHIDNSPNSVCEAMLLGMPVISTFVGGTGSLLINNKEGILIQNGDPYALSGAILKLLTNYEFAFKLGKNARESAFARHDPEKIIENLMRIYEELIKK